MPAFMNMLCQGDIDTRGKATMILGTLGKDALAVVSPILSSADPTNRCLAAFIVGNCGADAVPLIPKLQALLTDRHLYARATAAEALLKLHSDPQPLVPVLLRCFREGDDDQKLYVPEILGRFTNCPSVAVPALLSLLDVSTNIAHRMSIYDALLKLDPKVAAKVRTNVLPFELPQGAQ